MYELRKITDKDQWSLQVGGKRIVEGPLVKVWQKMVWKFNISNGDVRFALSEMQKKDHVVAKFGVFGCFILTSKE